MIKAMALAPSGISDLCFISSLLFATLLLTCSPCWPSRDRANRFIGERRRERLKRTTMKGAVECVYSWWWARSRTISPSSTCFVIVFAHNGFCEHLLLLRGPGEMRSGNSRRRFSGQSSTHKTIMMMRVRVSVKEIVILYFFNVTIITWLNCLVFFTSLPIPANSNNKQNMTKFDASPRLSMASKFEPRRRRRRSKAK